MRPPKSAIDGLFYRDSTVIRNKLKLSPSNWSSMPPIPKTNWVQPDTFPNLSASRVIGIDTETYDPELLNAGPGFGRGVGHIIGISIAAEDSTSWYFPMRHGIMPDGKQILPPDEVALNIDPETVLAYMRQALGTVTPKVGTNIQYDVGWLAEEKVEVKGMLYDIGIAEALINSETPSVSLDALALKYLGIGKETEAIYEWLARWNGRPANDRQRQWLYVTPPSLAGPYAMADAALPIKILEAQWPVMSARGVLPVFDMETRLLPVLTRMRLNGIPVDLQRAHQVASELGDRLTAMESQLYSLVGSTVNPTSPQSLTKAFNSLGIPLPFKKENGGEEKVSFDKARLGAIDHPFAKAILEHRATKKMKETFIEAYIIEKAVGNKLFTSFHPLRNDGGGTRSGRLSSSNPNMQNIPSRGQGKKLVRSIFSGKAVGNVWRSMDYSSIEYRLLASYASGGGSEEVRAIFANNPDADYHTIVKDMVLAETGLDISRDQAKTISFGLIYGMQLPALAAALNLPRDEAKHLLDSYHDASPYIRATMQACEDEIVATGSISTILGRKSDFSLWQPKGFQEGGRPMPVPYAEAKANWGFDIERSGLYRGLNRRLQGSAADIIKLAMVTGYESGLFDDSACGMPKLNVHDELCFASGPHDSNHEVWKELVNMMENCASDKLKVPLRVDHAWGDTWAEC